MKRRIKGRADLQTLKKVQSQMNTLGVEAVCKRTETLAAITEALTAAVIIAAVAVLMFL